MNSNELVLENLEWLNLAIATVKMRETLRDNLLNDGKLFYVGMKVRYWDQDYDVEGEPIGELISIDYNSEYPFDIAGCSGRYRFIEPVEESTLEREYL